MSAGISVRRPWPCVHDGVTQTPPTPVGAGSAVKSDSSDAPTLARAASVMRDRGHVTDRGDGEAAGLQRAKSGLTAGAGTRNLDLEGAHAVLGSLAARVLGSDLCGVRGRLARTLEAHGARGRP